MRSRSSVYGLCLLGTVLAAPACAMPADCSGALIPTSPVLGHVGGRPFEPGNADLHITKDVDAGRADGGKSDRYELTLIAGSIFDNLSVTLAVPAGTSIDGKSFLLVPGQKAGDAAGVQSWALQLQSANVETDSAQGAATLRLELSPKLSPLYEGKIYFCAPSANAEIMGTFQANSGR